MIQLTWAIAVLTVLMAGIAAIQLRAMLTPPATVPEVPVKWSGFYYPSLESQRGKAIEAGALTQAPTFLTAQECVEWGRRRTESTPAAGFECASGYRFDQGVDEVVCRDSTRVMR